MRTLLLVGLLVLIVGGYFGYRTLVENPPDFLTELVTKQDPAPVPPAEGEVVSLSVPEGFVATVYSRETPGARVLTRDSKGVLLASLTQSGKVVALPDYDGNGVADETKIILEGLDKPHGILIHCPSTGNASADQDACMLYVAETGALARYNYDADTLSAAEREVLATLPTGGGGHYTRTLLMHPNGADLLLSVGSSCNVCTETDDRRATVLSYNMGSGELTTYATGLRNTVFMAIDPVSGRVWGADHGRDLIGDDVPPDEINILEEGSDYGWPRCYGMNVHDGDFDAGGNTDACTSMTPPHIALQAHSAPLGIAFIPEEGWSEDMALDLLIAYHGSWNRSVPTGYKVVRFDLDQNNRSAKNGAIDFMSGFLPEGAPEEESIGRPTGLLAEPGGVLYVADDKAGAIYRVTRTSMD